MKLTPKQIGTLADLVEQTIQKFPATKVPDSWTMHLAQLAGRKIEPVDEGVWEDHLRKLVNDCIELPVKYDELCSGHVLDLRLLDLLLCYFENYT